MGLSLPDMAWLAEEVVGARFTRMAVVESPSAGAAKAVTDSTEAANRPTAIIRGAKRV